MNQTQNTVAETVKKRIERLSEQESNVEKEILRVQKRIDDLPKHKARLEDLKAKKKTLETRRKAELQEIEALTKLVSDGGLTISK
jgi:chaperonin cofactor prefoldin